MWTGLSPRIQPPVVSLVTCNILIRSRNNSNLVQKLQYWTEVWPWESPAETFRQGHHLWLWLLEHAHFVKYAREIKHGKDGTYRVMIPATQASLSSYTLLTVTVQKLKYLDRRAAPSRKTVIIFLRGLYDDIHIAYNAIKRNTKVTESERQNWDPRRKQNP